MDWNDPDWEQRVHSWITAQLEAHDLRWEGSAESIHSLPWSRVLRVPSRRGPLYFKASPPVFTYEPALTAKLHELFRDQIPEVIAVAPESGWLLMSDAGTTLRATVSGGELLKSMELVFSQVAALQLGCVEHTRTLLTLGVPDRRLIGLPDLFQRLLDKQLHSPVPAPQALTPEEIWEGQKHVQTFAELCSELALRGVPETLHHDDFHDGNIFVDVDLHKLRVADWAESAVAHPFCTLTVGLRSAAYRATLPEDSPPLRRLADAYLEPWSACGTLTELRETLALARRIGRIIRALTWSNLISSLSVAEQQEEGATQAWIRLYLEGERDIPK